MGARRISRWAVRRQALGLSSLAMALFRWPFARAALAGFAMGAGASEVACKGCDSRVELDAAPEGAPPEGGAATADGAPADAATAAWAPAKVVGLTDGLPPRAEAVRVHREAVELLGKGNASE